MAIQPVACRGRGVEKAGLGVRKRVHGESLSLRIREPARGAHRHRATDKKKDNVKTCKTLLRKHGFGYNC